MVLVTLLKLAMFRMGDEATRWKLMSYIVFVRCLYANAKPSDKRDRGDRQCFILVKVRPML